MIAISRSQLSLLRIAAELRASGLSWERIAAQLDRSPRTCRAWRQRHYEVWTQLFRAATNRVYFELYNDAQHLLHRLMVDEDKRIRRDVTLYLHRAGDARLDREAGTARAASGNGSPDDGVDLLARQLAEFMRRNDRARALTNELLGRTDPSGAGAVAVSKGPEASGGAAGEAASGTPVAE